MKKNWILSAVLFALVACSNEQVVSTSAGTVLLQLSGTKSMVINKAADTEELAKDTKIGVYALSANSSWTDTPYKNALYTATGLGGAFTSIAPITLMSNQVYDVVAYAPRLGATSATSLLFAHGTDVLYVPASHITVTSATSAAASLTFDHKMAQIKFALLSGTSSPALTNATILATGFYGEGMLNLTTGDLLPVAATTATVNELNTPVCIVPTATPMTIHLTVTTADGNVYPGTITAAFDASKSYTYTLTLNLNTTSKEMVIGDVSVSQWVTQDGGSAIMTE